MPGYRRVILTALISLLVLVGATSYGAAATGLAQSGATGPATVAQTFTGTDRYVALGDSFAAGPFIPVQRTDPLGCARSSHNYPALIAEDLGVTEFTDVTCSAATTANMTTAQVVLLGSNPPQFDALHPDTDLVTVSIGGNDIGFSDIVLTCGRLSLTEPAGDPCRRQALAGGSDLYAERILQAAPKVAGVLREIHHRAPNASVLLVGYLRILPPARGCWPVVPISAGDVPYLDGIQQQLTQMLATQARDNGATFVDAYAASLGHDTCQLPTVKWVEGILPTSPAFPVHPNARGMRAVAELILGTSSG
ncbi:MAG TPA: SGNH/GDSL hydrolase family protein [Pseudonocardiaceae bacterium]|nr:SGNH/GDSL hydrolase family protein [Pseudonocardiaceae bacterium]